MAMAVGGQTLRRVGLLIEALCMIALISVARGNDAGWRRAGLDPSVLLALGIGVGFLLWAYGTFLILRERRRARAGRPGA